MRLRTANLRRRRHDAKAAHPGWWRFKGSAAIMADIGSLMATLRATPPPCLVTIPADVARMILAARDAA